MLNKQKVRQIYEALPKLNCGSCGYTNCGNYARAVAEGKAPSYLCIGGLYVAQRVSEVIGVKLPAFTYGLYTMSFTRRERELRILRQEESVLIRQTEDLRRRVEWLANMSYPKVVPDRRRGE